MANMMVLLSDLRAGRSSSTVQVWLPHLWEAKNFRRGGELMGVDMLLLDSQSRRKLYAWINKFCNQVFLLQKLDHWQYVSVNEFSNQAAARIALSVT
ncbi:unnamed protein product [Eruca vesicaria subsp. sativa]|uniref:Uncharacterized protein n=1 Tax=Eruca vesicaria subsp. sativa TaxID=29727 RepID=A0ABC8JMF7_ERUVS|nr:unnamed protein product [Eruca vesicaria subsp. sativa]